MKNGKTSTFFMNQFGKPTCLICHVSIAVNKEFNIKRHYDTKHSNFSKFVGQAEKTNLIDSKIV